MIHLFQEALNLFDEVKAKIEGAATAATSAVSSGLSWPEEEIKAAEVEFFKKVETASMTLSQAFQEGAKWAAARMQSATSAPTASPTFTGTVTYAEPAVPVLTDVIPAAPIVAATMAPEAPVEAPADAAPVTETPAA